jgi:hypothetical protein
VREVKILGKSTPNCSSLLIIDENLLIQIIQTALLDEKLHSLVRCWDLHSLLIYIAHKKMIWVEGTTTMAGLA